MLGVRTRAQVMIYDIEKLSLSNENVVCLDMSFKHKNGKFWKRKNKILGALL